MCRSLRLWDGNDAPLVDALQAFATEHGRIAGGLRGQAPLTLALRIIDGDEVGRMLLGMPLDAGIHRYYDGNVEVLRGRGRMAELYRVILLEERALRRCEGVRATGEARADQGEGKEGKRQGRYPKPARLPSVLHVDPPVHIDLGERSRDAAWHHRHGAPSTPVQR